MNKDMLTILIFIAKYKNSHYICVKLTFRDLKICCKQKKNCERERSDGKGGS